jgi:hypothetical protein
LFPGEILPNTKTVTTYVLNVKDLEDGMWPSSEAKNPKRVRILLKINFAFPAF